MDRWLMLRVGYARARTGSVWHISDRKGATLCGFLADGRAIAGTPQPGQPACRLCTVIDQANAMKEEELWV